MRQSILIAAFALIANCGTFSTQTVTSKAPTPSREDSCAKFTGTKWFECLKEEKKMWQRRESATAKFEVISEDREGDYVIRKIEVCWDDFCRVYTERTYDLSFWSELKRSALIGVLFYSAGLLTGIGL